MLSECERVVVGLSGGADSVCLLRVLHSIIEHHNLPVLLVAVHVNHGIRGDEAVKDQEFSRQLCQQLGVEFVAECFDIPEIAAREGISEEEAGRNVRYTVFRRLAGDSGKIAVAHHMDDQAETVLMNLFRGSSLKGMGGMLPVRDNIIRPLLCVTRQEIELYLKKLGQDFVTDSTNMSQDYTRNRMRNTLIPYIKENFNPEVSRHVVELSWQLRRCQAYIDRQIQEFIHKHVVKSSDENVYSIDVGSFNGTDPVIKSGVIMEVFNGLSSNSKDIYKCHVDSVMKLACMQVGKSVNLPYDMWAKKDYGSIVVGRGSVESAKAVKCYVEVAPSRMYDGIFVPMNGKIFVEDRLRTVVGVSFEVLDNVFGKEYIFDKKNVYTKFFDYDRIKGALVLRYRQEGDYISVQRDGGSKKFKKELIDKKVPKDMRDSVLLLTEQSKVLWAMGVRRSEEYLLNKDTMKVLKVCLECQEDE